MARRSTHTAKELRELILQAATGLIQEHGLAGVSAREIARRISYSPGTIYNVFENLEDIIKNIQSRMLQRLAEQLAAIPKTSSPRTDTLALAHAYLEFSRENPGLWSLLYEHRPPDLGRSKTKCHAQLEPILKQFEDALAPLMTAGSRQGVQHCAQTLWAGLHGIASVTCAGNLLNVSGQTASALVDEFVNTYVNGLGHECSEE